MWKYEQESGAVIRPDGTLLARGYSGMAREGGMNNPDMQCVPDVGPIPRGFYTIQDPRNSTRKRYYIPLEPNPGTDVCGRHSFQIHGDNESHTASTGCIVVREIELRREIGESADRLLRVVRSSIEVTAAKLRRAPQTRFRG
jgi:hypothetical protein